MKTKSQVLEANEKSEENELLLAHMTDRLPNLLAAGDKNWGRLRLAESLCAILYSGMEQKRSQPPPRCVG